MLCSLLFFFPKKGWSPSLYFKLNGGLGGGHRMFWAEVSGESLVRSSLEPFPFSWEVEGEVFTSWQCRAVTHFCDQERKDQLTELRIRAPLPALLGNLALASQHQDLEQERNLFLPSSPSQQRPTCSSTAWRWVSAGWTAHLSRDSCIYCFTPEALGWARVQHSALKSWAMCTSSAPAFTPASFTSHLSPSALGACHHLGSFYSKARLPFDLLKSTFSPEWPE